MTASRSDGALFWRVGELDAVVEPDTLNDFPQKVLALEAAPYLGCGYAMTSLKTTSPRTCASACRSLPLPAKLSSSHPASHRPTRPPAWRDGQALIARQLSHGSLGAG